jgi:hypothetical protein
MIDPRGLEVVEWCDLVALPLAPFVTPTRLLDPALWKNWAMGIIGSTALAPFNPPDPRTFEDWRDWAFRFNQVVPY